MKINKDKSQHSSLFGIWSNLIATFLISTAMGMTAILFPVALENNSVNTSMIGIIMSLETIASIVICFGLAFMLRRFGMQMGMVLTTIIRIPPVLFMAFSGSLMLWSTAIFIHAAGCFIFLLLTQTWINAIPFKKNMGLWMAIYSTAMSIGLAFGPVVLSVMESSPEYWLTALAFMWKPIALMMGHNGDITINQLEFLVSVGINLLATIPVLVAMKTIPSFSFTKSAGIWKSIMECKGPMFSLALAGVSMFGVSAFITLYGLRNGLSLTDAALLFTFFNVGAIMLEIPIGWISDRFDRRYMIVICTFLCMVCAVYLPIAIYVNYQAWILVFIWGGVVGSIYSLALTIVGEQFEGEDLIGANAGYSVMEGLGGTAGILLIGFCMDILGADGLPYVIMFSSIFYFSFALTRYRVV